MPSHPTPPPGPVRGLIAVHRDAKAARRSIARLTAQGVDAGAIHLASAREQPADTAATTRTLDAGSMGVLGRRFAVGSLLGLLVGAVAGAVLLTLTGPADDTTRLALMGALGGAMVGGGLGAVLGLLSTPQMSGAWERTFAEHGLGFVVLGVEGVNDRRVACLRTDDVVDLRIVDDLETALATLKTSHEWDRPDWRPDGWDDAG